MSLNGDFSPSKRRNSSSSDERAVRFQLAAPIDNGRHFEALKKNEPMTGSSTHDQQPACVPQFWMQQFVRHSAQDVSSGSIYS
jgi:hypothetical protein